MSEKRNWTGFRWADNNGQVCEIEKELSGGGVWMYVRTKNGVYCGGGGIGTTDLESLEMLGRHLNIESPKKLSDAFLFTLRNMGPTDTEVALMDHIQVIMSERTALMRRAREDADRVGAARIEFEDQQQKRIEALRKTLQVLAEAAFFEEDKAIARDALEADDQNANGPG